MTQSPEVLAAAAFEADFAAEVRRAKRYSTLLAYLELDVEAATAEGLSKVLRRGLRESDLVGDLGGGRFGIVLISADEEAAGIVLGRLSAAARAASLDLRARRAIFPFDGLDTASLRSALR